MLLLGLAACGSSPVARNAVAPPDNVVGDEGLAGISAPANGAAAEATDRAATPTPTDGMTWRWDEATKSARFGPSADALSFSIACDRGRLVLRRFDAAPHDGVATMSFTGNGRVASLPARAVGDTTRMTSLWQAVQPPSDMTDAVARVFSGRAPVEIVLSGTTTLVAAPSSLPARAFGACPRA